MSRTPADSPVEIVRGATWEDYWDYYEDDGVTPIDLSAYEARLQVRDEDALYGTTGTALLEALTTGATPQLFIEAVPGAPNPAIKNRVRIKVEAADTVALNPDNERKVRRGYGIELYIPAGVDPEYVLPYAQGWANIHGERVR